MSDPLKYIPPDYTGIAESLHPTEDGSDGLEELLDDETDVLIEQELDRQDAEETYNRKMTNNIFVEGNKGRNSFGVSGAPPGFDDPAPWQTEGARGFGKWGSSPSGSSLYNNSSSTLGSSMEATAVRVEGVVPVRYLVITDFLDCLYESWDSKGRPNIFPRGIYDLIPKLDIWSRIASFGLSMLGIAVSNRDLKRLVDDDVSSSITLSYVAQCLSSFLRIPKENIIFLNYADGTSSKADLIQSALMKTQVPRNQAICVGCCSGRWGLSNRDINAAHETGVEYIDVYNLRDGKYIIE